MFETVIPSSPHATRSIESVPMPQVLMNFNSGNCLSTSPGQVTAPRELIIAVAPAARWSFSLSSAGRLSNNRIS